MTQDKYTTEQVIEALKVFSSRNEVRPPEDTKFEAYQVLDWHIKQLENPVQHHFCVFESALDEITELLKLNGRIWGYSGTDERFQLRSAIVHIFDELKFYKGNNGIQ